MRLLDHYVVADGRIFSIRLQREIELNAPEKNGIPANRAKP